MRTKKAYSELDLLEFSRCALRRLAVDRCDSPGLIAAGELLRKSLLMEFEDRTIIRAGDARKILGACWPGPSGEVNRQGLGLVPVISRRIVELVMKHGVYQPLTGFTLTFGKGEVTGEYAVLMRRGAKALDEAKILRLRDSTPARRRHPDALDYARWLHFRMYEPGAGNIRILNYCVDSDVEWYTDFSDQIGIQSALVSLVDYRVSGFGVPTPGDHCDSCQSKACLSGKDGRVK